MFLVTKEMRLCQSHTNYHNGMYLSSCIQSGHRTPEHFVPGWSFPLEIPLFDVLQGSSLQTELVKPLGMKDLIFKKARAF